MENSTYIDKAYQQIINYVETAQFSEDYESKTSFVGIIRLVSFGVLFFLLFFGREITNYFLGEYFGQGHEWALHVSGWDYGWIILFFALSPLINSFFDRPYINNPEYYRYLD